MTRIRTLYVALAALFAVLVFAPALAQDATEAVDGSGLPQSVTDIGFPQLGQPDAPVQMVEFCSYDVVACAAYHHDVVTALLPRITRGEILYTVVPLAGIGDIPNGRGAGRAAICASEQGAFWQFSNALYDSQTDAGAQAFDSSRLIAAVEALGLDRDQWDACMLSERPDSILDAGAATLQFQTNFSGSIPFILIDQVPSLPDLGSVLSAVDAELAEATQAAEATPEGTEPPLVITVEPLLGQEIEPPLSIDLPANWQFGYDTLILNDVDGAIRTIPIAVYMGPVTGGQGTIVLLWGFPNLVGGNPFMGGAAADLWSDGLRLLRLAIVEEGCNVGTDLRTDYTLGGAPAVGTQFSAVDCPDLPDTRGWFAGAQEQGINFVFYVYSDPIDAMNTAHDELQGVLDTVRFHIPEATPTPEE